MLWRPESFEEMFFTDIETLLVPSTRENHRSIEVRGGPHGDLAREGTSWSHNNENGHWRLRWNAMLILICIFDFSSLQIPSFIYLLNKTYARRKDLRSKTLFTNDESLRSLSQLHCQPASLNDFGVRSGELPSCKRIDESDSPLDLEDGVKSLIEL